MSFPSHIKRALVTGASSGLGKAFAEMLIAQGVEVWGTSRCPSRLESLPGLHPLVLDLADRGSLSQFLAEHRDLLETFDLVINNAGNGAFFPFESMPEDVIVSQLFVLLEAPVFICRAVYPSMRARGSGVIVNVSSLAVDYPLPYMNLYNTAKAGLSGFSRGLQIEAEGTGVCVIDLQPGDYRTEFNNATQRKPTVSGETEGAVERAWKYLEKHLAAAPLAEKAGRDLKKAISRKRSGIYTTGDFFQATLGPIASRFLGWRWVRWFIRKYYQLDKG